MPLNYCEQGSAKTKTKGEVRGGGRCGSVYVAKVITSCRAENRGSKKALARRAKAAVATPIGLEAS